MSLDELPQVINVLKGEMSLVGPRPEMPFIVAEYDEIHKERLKVLPGITGLWQLSGDRKKAIHENMDYDLYYIRNMSFFLDMAILIETFIFAFRGILNSPHPAPPPPVGRDNSKSRDRALFFLLFFIL